MADEQPAVPGRAGLSIAVLWFAAAQAAFWVYTWYYLIKHANPKGDGMELMATMPLTLVLLIFVLPAWLMSRRAPRTSAVLAATGLVCNTLLWIQILSELAPHAQR